MYFDESIGIRLRKEEKDRLEEYVKFRNDSLDPEDEISLSDQVRVWILQNTKLKGDWKMTYQEDKRKAIEYIDDHLTEGESIDRITAYIERKWGFGERMVTGRKARLERLKEELEDDTQNQP